MTITLHTSADNKTYKLTDTGTFYHKDTTFEIIKVLENCRLNNIRVQLFYGDIETGRDWNEEHGTIGTIGRSSGTIKIPLLIPTIHSIGGGGILDNCILKIRDAKTKIVLYVAPNYQPPIIEIVPGDRAECPYNTTINGTLYGRHKTLKSAQMLKNKLQ